MTIFCMILLVFFAIIGLCAFILSIVRIFADRYDQNDYLIVILKTNGENAEYSIRSAIRKINDLGKGEILCLCEEDDKEAAEICQRMKNDCPYLKIVSKTTLKEILDLT